MNRKVLIQTYITGILVVALFWVLFVYFHMHWLWAGFLALILGETLVLVPLYVLFWKELKK